MSDVRIRRVYDEPSPEDGARVLVNRLWPRGMSKQRARFDSWEKEVAPSTELRRWYGHDPAKFAEFARRYRRELDDPEHHDALGRVRDLAAGGGPLTLLTASRDVEHSQAAVLVDVLG